IYGSADVASGNLKDTAETNAPRGKTPDRTNATYKLGHRFTEDSTLNKETAWMHDTPKTDGSANHKMVFETTALALEGAQAGSYYGSVRWGFETDGTGKLKKIPFALVSAGVPSQKFLAAATTWNAATAQGTVVTIADNTSVVNGGLKEQFKLAKDQ